MRRFRAPGMGSLVLLALLLLASAALRLGADVGQALAAAEDPAPSAAPLSCPLPPLALAEALSQREARLRTQEMAIEERRAALDLADTAIAQRMAALEQAEAALRATLALADGAAEADLARLTAVYQSMKPKEAAALFARMDAQFAAGFLGRMSPETAAAVLSAMEPDAAFAMTTLLATRNAAAPRE